MPRHEFFGDKYLRSFYFRRTWINGNVGIAAGTDSDSWTDGRSDDIGLHPPWREATSGQVRTEGAGTAMVRVCGLEGRAVCFHTVRGRQRSCGHRAADARREGRGGLRAAGLLRVGWSQRPCAAGAVG